MKTFFCLLLAVSLCTAQTAPIAEKLRQGLFAEEAERDLEKAAKAYEAAVQLYNADRRQAATALFRLAEIRRKQGNAQEAAQLYQRVLAEFAEDATLAKLSRENLSGMGLTPAETSSTVDAEAAEIARLDSLFKTSPDLVNSEQKDGDKTTSPPLHVAAAKNQLRVVTFLLEKGCRLDLRDSTGRTALDTACESGHLEIAKLLIDKGADIHGKERGVTPLGSALMNKRLQLARFLIDKGADVNRVFSVHHKERKTTLYHTPLTMVTQLGDLGLFELLIAHKADPNASQLNKGEMGWNYPPVLIAAQNNAPELLKRLLAAGAGTELSPGMPGDSPLTESLKLGNLECVTLLLDSKAKIQQDVMSFAARLGDKDLLLRLIQAGGDINEVSQFDTPLIHAAKQDAQKVPDAFLRFLIQHGASAKKALGQARPPVSSGGMYSGMSFERGQIVRSTLYADWFELPQITWAPQNTAMPVRQSTDEPSPAITDLWREFSSLKKASILRKAANEAGFERFDFDLIAWSAAGGDPAKVPELRWGDVIEFDAFEQHEESEGLAEKLRAARRVPFSVTIDGVRREFVLHGGATVFDPTQNIVPGQWGLAWGNHSLRSVQSVLKLLGTQDPRLDGRAVQLSRGAADQRDTVTLDVTQTNTYRLVQAGDAFVIPKAEKPRHDANPSIVSPGLPLSWSFSQEMTLLEALAAFLNTEEVVLPAPDWSRLTLQRWNAKTNAYEPRRIDFAAAMADPASDPRPLDLAMHKGDIIELPALPPESAKGWTGADEASVRFFQRALARTMKIRDFRQETRDLRVSWISLPLKKDGLLWHRLPVADADQAEGKVTAMTPGALSEAMSRVNAGGQTHLLNGTRGGKTLRGGVIREGDLWQFQVHLGNSVPVQPGMPGLPMPVQPRPQVGQPQ